MFSKKRTEFVAPEDKGYRDHDNLGYLPRCSHCGKDVIPEEDAVVWDGMDFNIEQFYKWLTPVAKLTALSNPDSFIEEHNKIYMNAVWHPSCAAYFGMHLIADSVKSRSISERMIKG